LIVSAPGEQFSLALGFFKEPLIFLVGVVKSQDIVTELPRMMKRQPLDLNPHLQSTGIQVARFLSNLFSPMSSFAIFAFILGWVELSFWQGLIQGAIFGFWAALLPIVYILYQLKTGKITDLHISVQAQRHVPYIIGIVGSIVAMLIYLVIDGSPVLINLSLAVMLTLVATALINLRWLISSHTTSASLVAAFSGIVYGPQYWLVLTPFVALVFFIRKYLRRHDYPELFGGVALGISVVVIMALAGRFG
jgi:hypothetical protein